MKDIPETKYITCTPEGNYRITKKIKGKTVQFGVYKELETAVYYRDYFQNKGWENCLDERTLYTDTNKRDYNLRFIRKSNDHYRIDKDINQKKYNFGTYDTLEEAMFFRDYFEENDWPLTERLEYTNKPVFISGNPDRGWEVRKYIDGECLHMGLFHNYDDALAEVELCKKYNWDLDSICESPDLTDDDGVISFVDGKKAKKSFFQKYNAGRNDGFLFHRGIKN